MQEGSLSGAGSEQYLGGVTALVDGGMNEGAG
jgi:hypothetical protein